MHTAAACPLLLAIELPQPPATPPRTLAVEEAARLVDIVAADLARIVPGVERLGLALAGALYDQAQVLRPGWPLFEALAELYARQRRGNPVPHLLGFGQSAGRMAVPALEPDRDLGTGTLAVVPIVLPGDETTVRETVAWLDAELGERGLAGAEVALFVRDAWGLAIGHARYLTHHDLAALAAVQLEHAGFAGAWSLIEAALLSPAHAQSAFASSGQPWRYANGGVRCGLLGLAAFRALHAQGGSDDTGAAFEQWLVQQRQFGALVGAHGLAPVFVEADAAALADPAALDGATPLPLDGWIERLTPGSDGERRLVAHHAGPWGVLGYSVAERRGDGWRALAHGWPATAAGDRAVREQLAAEYGVQATPAARQRMVSDVPGLLGPPAP
jgi:hypothetical protein